MPFRRAIGERVRVCRLSRCRCVYSCSVNEPTWSEAGGRTTVGRSSRVATDRAGVGRQRRMSMANARGTGDRRPDARRRTRRIGRGRTSRRTGGFGGRGGECRRCEVIETSIRLDEDRSEQSRTTTRRCHSSVASHGTNSTPRVTYYDIYAPDRLHATATRHTAHAPKSCK